MVIGGKVRTSLHMIQEPGPNGQYLVRMPTKVMGIVTRQSIESAKAKVAIKMLRAVCISENDIKR